MKKQIFVTLFALFLSSQALAWDNTGYSVNIHGDGRIHQNAMGDIVVQGGNGRTTIRQNAMGDTIIQGPQGRTTIRQNMMGDIDVRGNLPEGISVTPLQQDRWGSRW